MRGAPGCELHVVHVEEAVPMRSHAFMSQEEIDKLYRDEAQQRCASVLEYLKGQNVPYQWHLVVGEAAEQIVRAATSLGADTLVVGSRGLGTVSSLVLGSVTSQIIHDAPMPVTVVK
jgi:nucleotide-binding universal stress UspA family protein